jgi:hypothetical protein
MPRSIHAGARCALGVALAFAAVVSPCACAQPSQSPPVVAAPSASDVPAAATVATPASAMGAPSSAPAASAPPASATFPAPSSSVPAQYRACASDADCVAVPRAVCCNHGWKEAVAATQKDAYARDFACKEVPRPMCPMFMVRDARVAKCDAQQRLCVMAAQP